MSVNWVDQRSAISRLNYARDLATQLNAEARYNWSPYYWSSEELEFLIQSFEKRLRWS